MLFDGKDFRCCECIALGKKGADLILHSSSETATNRRQDRPFKDNCLIQHDTRSFANIISYCRWEFDH
jgi:hypothetical protein